MDNFRDSYFQVDWDLTTKRLRGTYWGKQYDTGRGFAVTVINGGQVVAPTTEVLRLKWEKPDNTSGYVNATIVNGKFIVENIDQMFTVHGSVRADFELSVGGEFVASITFYVNVEKAVAVDAVASSSQFTALQDAVGSVDSLQQQFNNVVANVTVDSEVIAARGTKATLGARLDSTDAQLNDIEQDFNAQLAETANNLVDHKLDYATLIKKSSNLVDHSDIITGKKPDLSTGELIDDITVSTTNFIKILPNTVYASYRVIQKCFYDADRNFISGNQTSGIWTTPINAHFVKITGSKTAFTTDENLVQLNLGGTLLGFEPYYRYIKKEVINQTELLGNLEYFRDSLSLMRNLFNGYRTDITVSSEKAYNNVFPSSTGLARTIAVPILGGKTYAVKVEGTHNRFLLGLANSLAPYTPLVRLHHSSFQTEYDEYIFTNSANHNYLLLTVSTISQEPKIVLVEDTSVPVIENEIKINGKSVLFKEDSFDLSNYEMRRYSQYFSLNTLKGGVPATYGELYSSYNNLIENSGGYVYKQILGQDGQSNDIAEYQFRIPAVSNNQGYKRLKIGIISGLHGNEKNPATGLLEFLKHLTLNPYKSEILNKIKSVADFYILPVTNPSGWDADTRNNWNNVNLNRNFDVASWNNIGDADKGETPASELETQIIQSWIDTNDFDYFLDCHNSGQVDNIINWISAGTISEPAIKIPYMKAISELSVFWAERYPEFPKNVVFGEAPARVAQATSKDYADAKGVISATLETVWQVNYSDSGLSGPVANTCAAEIIGNMILQICREYF